jgi:hypothetical protein
MAHRQAPAAHRPYRWQAWSLDWQPPGIGRHTLRARATDAVGNVQPDVPRWNRLGYGDNAIEVMYVDVREHHRGGGSEREIVARPLPPSGAELVRAELVRVQPALLACASDRATRS